MNLTRAVVFGSVTAVIGALTGCGSAGLVPVEGVVTLDGKPLVGVTVALERMDGPAENRLFAGETDAQGRYAVHPFEKSATGAPPGEYRVMITSVKASPGADEMTEFPREPVPEEFRNGSRTITVPEGGTTEANFAIQSRPY
jgi:hypothetical protein